MNFRLLRGNYVPERYSCSFWEENTRPWDSGPCAYHILSEAKFGYTSVFDLKPVFVVTDVLLPCSIDNHSDLQPRADTKTGRVVCVNCTMAMLELLGTTLCFAALLVTRPTAET